ncbi:SDR family NAD(P)-dependent oxidoreductase [Nocardia higoensis]|uniref:SDR family NAD(P)-dependent oxidoreductase n=1 Tax=Nocardia higoensis TaxID=228599 RepID=UPI001FE0C9ED|nr:SDR family NAD(P)-dependent oxidoreductase [Nocardia higoensis]
MRRPSPLRKGVIVSGSQHVVVTGATGGIGRASVRRFAADGASITLLARGVTGLTAAAEEIRAAGGRALPISTDVADFAAVEAAADRAESEFAR